MSGGIRLLPRYPQLSDSIAHYPRRLLLHLSRIFWCSRPLHRSRLPPYALLCIHLTRSRTFETMPRAKRPATPVGGARTAARRRVGLQATNQADSSPVTAGGEPESFVVVPAPAPSGNAQGHAAVVAAGGMGTTPRPPVQRMSARAAGRRKGRQAAIGNEPSVNGGSSAANVNVAPVPSLVVRPMMPDTGSSSSAAGSRRTQTTLSTGPDVAAAGVAADAADSAGLPSIAGGYSGGIAPGGPWRRRPLSLSRPRRLLAWRVALVGRTWWPCPSSPKRRRCRTAWLVRVLRWPRDAHHQLPLPQGRRVAPRARPLHPPRSRRLQRWRLLIPRVPRRERPRGAPPS